MQVIVSTSDDDLPADPRFPPGVRVHNAAVMAKLFLSFGVDRIATGLTPRTS